MTNAELIAIKTDGRKLDGRVAALEEKVDRTHDRPDVHLFRIAKVEEQVELQCKVLRRAQ